MEKNMENDMETLGPLKGVCGDITPIMENQMEKKMEKLNGNCNVGDQKGNIIPIMENQMDKKMENDMETGMIG